MLNQLSEISFAGVYKCCSYEETFRIVLQFKSLVNVIDFADTEFPPPTTNAV